MVAIARQYDIGSTRYWLERGLFLCPFWSPDAAFGPFLTLISAI